MIQAIDAAIGVRLARPALRTHLMYESAASRAAMPGPRRASRRRRVDGGSAWWMVTSARPHAILRPILTVGHGRKGVSEVSLR